MHVNTEFIANITTCWFVQWEMQKKIYSINTVYNNKNNTKRVFLIKHKNCYWNVIKKRRQEKMNKKTEVNAAQFFPVELWAEGIINVSLHNNILPIAVLKHRSIHIDTYFYSLMFIFHGPYTFYFYIILFYFLWIKFILFCMKSLPSSSPHRQHITIVMMEKKRRQ